MEAPRGKLVMGALDDPLERQADRVADRMMSGAGAQGVTRDHAAARPKATETRAPGTVEAPAIASEAIGSPGGPLEPTLRARFEPLLDRDFSDVRVHHDGLAARSTQAMGARAFTVGRDVVFGAGQYAPATPAGQRLIAHELTHVAQQGGGNVVRREPIPAARITADPTRGTLSPQQIELIDGVLRRHQIVLFPREKRATFDGQRMSLEQAIGIVRRESGVLLLSDETIAAYVNAQFYKYLPGGRGAGASPAAGGSSGLLRAGIPAPLGTDAPLRTLEPGLTGADIDRIRTFLGTGGLAAAPGLQPFFNGGPSTLDQITEQCRALVLPIIPRDKVAAIVEGEWSVLVRKALQAPLPPPPPFTVVLEAPPGQAPAADKPDKLASAVGWQGTWHLSHHGKFENTLQVQLSQGDGSVQRVFQFQVNATTGDVQAMVGVQAQSPDATLVDTRLFHAVHAAIKANAFLQIVGGITNVGGSSASGSLTLQIQGGVQAAVTLGPISAALQIGPTFTLQQGMPPDFSLNPAGQGGGSQLPQGVFPPFHGIPLIRGTF